MSDRRDDIYDTLSESKKLVGDLEVPTGDEYSLNSILAEFGQGAAEPAPKKEETAAAEPPAAEDSPAEPTPAPAPRRAKVLQFPGIFAPAAQEEGHPGGSALLLRLIPGVTELVGAVEGKILLHIGRLTVEFVHALLRHREAKPIDVIGGAG
jgi:hypothetical protein